MRRQWRLCFAVAVTSSAASGQTTQGGGTDQNAPSSITLAGEAAKDGVFDFDFTVPTSPALALAGLSQDKATVQSAALKPFVFSLPAVLSGKGGQSAALDMSPAWLFEGEGRRSYSRYTAPENYFYRLVYRTRLNAAIYNGTDDKVEAKKQKGSRLAFGVSSSLLDSSDPLMAGASDGRPSQWQQCLGELQPEVRQVVEIETPHEVREVLIPVPSLEEQDEVIESYFVENTVKEIARQAEFLRQASSKDRIQALAGHVIEEARQLAAVQEPMLSIRDFLPVDRANNGETSRRSPQFKRTMEPSALSA
jgi:hypothetical protein